MKFTCSVDINQKIDTIVEIFLDPRNLEHTQEGFISKELISGNSGKVGAKYKIVYEKLELIETILTNNLPKEFKGLYEHKHMVNTMKVSFESLNEDNTRYISEIEYTKFNGVLIKLIATLFPRMFKKQVLKWMHLFKDYAEKQ